METYRFEFDIVVLNLGYNRFDFVILVDVGVLKLKLLVLRLFNSGSRKMLGNVRVNFLVVLNCVFEVHLQGCHGAHTIFEFFHLLVVCKF